MLDAEPACIQDGYIGSLLKNMWLVHRERRRGREREREREWGEGGERYRETCACMYIYIIIIIIICAYACAHVFMCVSFVHVDIHYSGHQKGLRNLRTHSLGRSFYHPSGSAPGDRCPAVPLGGCGARDLGLQVSKGLNEVRRSQRPTNLAKPNHPFDIADAN